MAAAISPCFQAGEIDAAGNFVAPAVPAIPNIAVFTILQVGGAEFTHKLTPEVVDAQAGRAAFGQGEPDGGGGIEGVGEVAEAG